MQDSRASLFWVLTGASTVVKFSFSKQSFGVFPGKKMRGFGLTFSEVLM